MVPGMADVADSASVMSGEALIFTLSFASVLEAT